MSLTLSGTDGVVGAGFTLDASGASVTAGVGTFGSLAAPAAGLTGALPAISAANLTNLPAANITGDLPAISGANLTGIGRKVTYGSWVTTTSGTEIEFTSIAATTDFAIDFLNVSAAANQELQTTIGDSGGYETSGYQTATGYAGSGGNHHDPSANLWKTEGNANSSGQTTGRMYFMNMYQNWWYMQFFYLDSGGSPYFKFIHGHKELSAQLDRVKFDWDGGGAFDAGYMRYVKFEDV